MSLQGLRNFNSAYGFIPLHHKNSTGANQKKSEQMFAKLLCSVPVLGLIIAHKDKGINFDLSSRITLCTVGLFPLVFALDVIATVVTQPLGRFLENRKAQHLNGRSERPTQYESL